MTIQGCFSYLLSEKCIHLIEMASSFCQPIGVVCFRQQIEQKYSIRLGLMERGRPRKETNELPKV